LHPKFGQYPLDESDWETDVNIGHDLRANPRQPLHLQEELRAATGFATIEVCCFENVLVLQKGKNDQ
jgi:hypothetical protein